MQTFEQYLGCINQELDKANWVQEPKELVEPITYILSLGGKRIRPVLLLMGCELFGGKAEDALPAALAIEVFHNFTLLHDDIMDKADIRRGKPCVHKKWNENVAILSGDAMTILAYQFLAKTPSPRLVELWTEFNKVAIEVCQGQQYDMNFETQASVSMDEYMEMIKLKTSVMLAGALKMGAIIGGASKEDAEHIYQFGLKIGLAFQIQDDLLDLYADQEKFGKKIGGDIRENKKTYLLIRALELASSSQKQDLLNYFSQTDLSLEVKVQKIKAIYDELQIKRECQELIRALVEQGEQSLKAIQVSAADKQTLSSLSFSLMEREK